MALAQTSSNTGAKTAYTAQEYAVVVRQLGKFKQALQAEQAKSAKLRRYIANMSSKKAPNTAPSADASTADLQRLVDEQSALLDKLYEENTQHRESVERVTRLNRELMVANDKLKVSLLKTKKRQRCTHSSDTEQPAPSAPTITCSEQEQPQEEPAKRTFFRRFW